MSVEFPCFDVNDDSFYGSSDDRATVLPLITMKQSTKMLKKHTKLQAPQLPLKQILAQLKDFHRLLMMILQTYNPLLSTPTRKDQQKQGWKYSHVGVIPEVLQGKSKKSVPVSLIKCWQSFICWGEESLRWRLRARVIENYARRYRPTSKRCRLWIQHN